MRHIFEKFEKLFQQSKKIFQTQRIAFLWAVSYISILLITLIFSIFTYMQNYNIISNNLSDYTNKIVYYETDIVESRLEQIANVAIQLSLNTDFAETTSYSFPFTNQERYNVRKLVTDVSGYKVSDACISDIYFYYPHTDTIIVNGNDRAPEFVYESYGIGDADKYKEWYSKITNNTDSSFININVGNRNVLYFKYITRMSELYSQSPIILVQLDASKLVENNSHDYCSYIMDDNNSILAESKNSQEVSLKKFDLSDKDKTVFEDRDYLLYQKKIDNVSWKYCCLISKKSQLESLKTARNTIFITVFASLVIGMLCTYYFIKRNTVPIEKIIKKLSSSELNAYTGVNELTYIEDVVSNTINENNTYKKTMYRQKKYLVDNILNKVVQGMASQKEIEALLSLGVHFKYDEFLVVSIFIDNVAKIYFEDGEETSEKLIQAQFIITNILDELLGEDFNTYIFSDSTGPVCIISLNNSTEKNIKIIKEKVCAAAEFISEKFNFTFVSGFSDVHKNFQGIKDAYNESVEALDQRFMSSDTILEYSSISESVMNQYYYPIEKEELIIACLESGEFNACKEQLDNIFEVNFDKYHLSLAYARILMIDIMSTFVKAINQCISQNDNNFVQDMDIINQINKCENISDAKQLIYDVLQKFCDFTKTNIIVTSDKLVSDVTQFVEEYYNDEQLSVAMISTHFNVHPNYLSKVFKKKVGIGLLEYIMNKRIEIATVLIDSSDDTFEVISKKVGISSIRTFFRVFSKLVGMTPGKYREISKRKK